jgi:hypothetical protein
MIRPGQNTTGTGGDNMAKVLGTIRTADGDTITVRVSERCYYHGEDAWKCDGRLVQVGAVRFCEGTLLDVVARGLRAEYEDNFGKPPKWVTDLRTGEIVPA